METQEVIDVIETEVVQDAEIKVAPDEIREFGTESKKTLEAEIVTYTFEIFETDKPYKTLYGLAGDAFLHQQEQIKMEKQAKKVGFKSFRQMYKAYCASIAKVGGAVAAGNSTDFPDQPIALEAGLWKCDVDGVKGFEGNELVTVSHQPIMPVEILVNLDTGVQKVKIAFYEMKAWRTVIVDKSRIRTAREIVKLADCGIDVSSETARMLVKYLQDIEYLNAEAIPRRQSVGRLGYIADGRFSPYVPELTFDGDVCYTALYSAIKSHGSRQEWISTAIECRRDSLTARIVLSASLASVLVKPLGALPFFVHLWGTDSGTGKTVALMLAASVWGNPELGKYIQTFNATQVSQERTAAFLNSLPVLLDELQLSKDSHGRTNFDVYQLTQGVGRSRGNKNGGVDETPTWCNCFITTGETPITDASSGAGAVNRVIDVECTAGSVVIKDGMKISKTVKQNYGFIGREFVEIVRELSEESKLQDMYNRHFKALSELDTTEKQAMAAAVILTADEIATQKIFMDGEPLSAEKLSEFLQTKAAVSLGERAYSYMCDWVAANSKNFERYDEDGKLERAEGGVTYGRIEDDVAYIIKTEFEKALSAGGYSYKSVMSWLGANEKTAGEKDHSTVRRRLNGVSVRCVSLVLDDEPVNDDFMGVPF